jgi:hypothetical protein
MHKIKYLIAIACLSSSLVLPAYADYFDARHMVSQSIWGNDYGDTLVKFGGCENTDDCYGHDENDYHNIRWEIGDLSVQQGVYWLTESDDHDHGKLKLKYDYKIVSEDTHENSTDYGRIRLKDVDTDEILYEKVWLPEHVGDWKTKVVSLPGEYAMRNLQLVFETNNDDSGLTQLYVRNWKLEHKSEPKISGTITYKVNGETRYASNALVALQNKARTETYAYTSTNDRGEYTFFPVHSNQRFVVAATLDTYSGLKTLHHKVKNGHQYTADFRLTGN